MMTHITSLNLERPVSRWCEMKLKDIHMVPPIGWVYKDYDLKETITGLSFLNLIENINKARLDKNLTPLNNAEQLIQDQLCDTLGVAYCEEKGLGDIVHSVAQPIAKVIDKVVGTQIQGCSGCAQRRARLNLK